MKGIIRLFTILTSAILFFTVVISLSECGNKEKTLEPDKRGEAYANPATCVSCHKEVYSSYTHTAHFHTSNAVDGNKLQAESIANDHTFIFNDSLKITIDKRKDGLYQTAYFKGNKIRSERFDIAFGANEKAQTYGYWKGNRLYELPLSYFKEINNWANSPGFPSNLVYYDRAIVSHCFECHGSYLEKTFVQTGAMSVAEEYDKKSIIYGIDCQRCHGPAAEHVQYHLDNPTDKTAKYIKTYNALSRQLKVDMCAVCHGGNDLKTEKSTFKYKPGDNLASFYDPNFGANSNPDVHGNQAKLLEMSRCYLNSPKLTCTTCHNVHQQEKTDPALLSQKCMDCHKEQTHNFCKMASQIGSSITKKCIDCHMPTLPSNVISFKMSAKKETSQYLLHTHRIAIYPEQTSKILSLIKNAKYSN
jgi:nitrate/TMAO reductase-like tetraheme cytochrome c subunit